MPVGAKLDESHLTSIESQNVLFVSVCLCVLVCVVLVCVRVCVCWFVSCDMLK